MTVLRASTSLLEVTYALETKMACPIAKLLLQGHYAPRMTPVEVLLINGFERLSEGHARSTLACPTAADALPRESIEVCTPDRYLPSEGPKA
jgi:hypothetical protein